MDNLPKPLVAATCGVFETNRRLSNSLLWTLERNYFDRQGIQAWNTGAVPHYVTSNPTMARAYANVILAYLRDLQQANALAPEQPLYILELGSGCGRFAFYFLNYLQTQLAANPSCPSVKYVMTDFTQTNLDYWQQHSHLQPFIEQELLDFALVDAADIQAIKLTQSGTVLTVDTLANPLIVIANYFFDCLPQDAFVIDEGILYESLVTLTADNPDLELTTPDLIDHLELDYTDQETTADYYENSHFNAILADYQATLTDTALLFPCAALRCIEQLYQLASERLFFLSADKGYSRLEDLLNRPRPGLTRHGQGFSLMVNYHAMGKYVEYLGGTWLASPHRHTSININGFLFSTPEVPCAQTHRAYSDQIVIGGPDDFFALKKGLDNQYETLSITEILAYLRLSHWDFNIFLSCFPALIEKLEDVPESLYPDIFFAVQQIWANYYPIQEQKDLPFLLSMVLYGLEYYPEALDYMHHSQSLYGEDPCTSYNMAMCHYRLRQLEQAMDCLNRTLDLDPDFAAAKTTRIKLLAELKRRGQSL